jgi:hypothetical protein
LRQAEFNESQDERGHQNFRVALPIRADAHTFHAAADGQLGGVVKCFREWRISGDGEWLRQMYPKIKRSIDYCIETWDPRHTGTLEEPHHNTYDIEFWGPDGMCTSIYGAALTAMVQMGVHAGEDILFYEELRKRCVEQLETHLFNGEYFVQKVAWEGLRAADPVEASKGSIHGGYSPEARELLRREGPKYQYGSGCLSDGVIGAWFGAVAGVPEFLDKEKVRKHLLAVFAHNFHRDLGAHPNPQRPLYALGNEAGLVLCSWPRGDALTLPFVYSNEVWTGIEYQVASHLIMHRCVEEGLTIVRAARDRYDGSVRNPFNEYECGHWYARAMSSYALLQALSGARYDAVERRLYVRPQVQGDFACFISTATGYGLVGVRSGKPFLDVRVGKITVEEIVYEPYRKG